jgi:hypothetical protein
MSAGTQLCVSKKSSMSPTAALNETGFFNKIDVKRTYADCAERPIVARQLFEGLSR